jgi:hypothetical protein
METIQIGYQAFTSDGGEAFGAVRDITDDTLTIYVENTGEFVVPMGAVRAVHSQKVILTPSELDQDLRNAIRRAHDAELPGL